MILLFTSCGTDAGGEDDDKVQINPNIVEVKYCCEPLHGDYIMGYTADNETIYATNRNIIEIKIDQEFRSTNTEYLLEEMVGNGKPTLYMHLNHDFTHALLVPSSSPWVSSGELVEADIADQNYYILRDSTYNISSAVYWHGDDTKLVFYSYGNDQGLQAGYYLHDKSAGTDSLLLAHRSPIGPGEMLNGFDLSPDNKKLLIPDVRTTPTSYQPPQIVEYDLATQQADTLEVEFDVFFVKIGLWLRYSPDGNRILYSQFPQGSFGVITNDWSEMGIIELPSLNKRILDANTYEGGYSVQIAPTWSPDGQHIVYGSGPVFFPEGGKGKFSLYVLKNVDDPQNYQ